MDDSGDNKENPGETLDDLVGEGDGGTDDNGGETLEDLMRQDDDAGTLPLE
jgi:hypothetical protein